MRRVIILTFTCVSLVLGAVVASASADEPPGVGNVPNCISGANPVPFLQSEDPAAYIMRIIVSESDVGQPWFNPGPCITDAENAGYAIYLTIQWNGSDLWYNAAGFVTSMINTYDANGRVSIVGIGNEEGNQGVSPLTYADVYNVEAPYIHSAQFSYPAIAAPEITGQGASWLAQWMADEGYSPPDLNYISGHPYPSETSEPSYANSLRKYGYNVIFSEGVCGGPDTWMADGCLPYASALSLGATLSLEWAN